MINLLKILLQASIVSSLMIGIVVLFRLLFSKKLHPGIVSFLWLIVLIKLCFPVNLNVPFNIGDIFAEDTTSASELTSQDNESNASFYDTYDNLSGAENNYYVQNNVNDNLNQNNISAENSKQLNTKNNINMWNIFLWIWIAGMILTSAWFTATNILFLCKVKKHAMPFTDESILAMIEKYKKELGIKRKTEILSYQYIQTPLVFRYFSAKILLPANFKNIYDYGKMDGVIVHELTHIKRHDVLLAYCWTAVKAIYWFNPFVWIASFFQKEDAELTCDYKTIRAIDRRKRAEYGESLILAARLSGNSILSNTALSFSSCKSSIHKRINMILKPNKKSKSITVVSFLIILIMIFACFTSACQPTPENSAVIGKHTENTQNISEYVKSNFPDMYQESYSDNGADIIFDAIVETPESEQLLCYTTSSAPFTQTQIDTIIQGLFENQQLYNIAEVTKSEIEPEYLQALADLKNKQNNPSQYEATEEYYQERVDQLKERLDNAPVTAVLEPSDYKLKKSSSVKGVKYFSARGDLGKDQMAVLKISSVDESSTSGHNSYLEFINGNKYIDISEPYPNIPDNDPQNLKITKEEAIDMADCAVSKLGIENMSYSACSTGIVYNRVGDYPEIFSPQVPQAYLIYYTRNITGVQVTYDQRRSSFSNTDESYSVSRFYERIIVAVDDSGVAYIRWQGPLSIDGITDDNNQIIYFEDIMILAKKQLSYEYATFESLDQVGEGTAITQAKLVTTEDYGEVISNEVNIQKIALGLMQVLNKNGKYEYIPVWDFYGYSQTNYEDGQEIQYGNNKSLLTINAIDGSVINRDLGY